MTAPENNRNGVPAEWIIDHAPYGMLLLDSSGKIERINAPACRLFGYENAGSLCGRPIEQVTGGDPLTQIANAQEKTCVSVGGREIEMYTARHGESGKYLCCLRDVTAERLAAEAADRVIAQQMRTAQQIALLIGETAAGTKIALTELKEALNHE